MTFTSVTCPAISVPSANTPDTTAGSPVTASGDRANWASRLPLISRSSMTPEASAAATSSLSHSRSIQNTVSPSEVTTVSTGTAVCEPSPSVTTACALTPSAAAKAHSASAAAGAFSASDAQSTAANSRLMIFFNIRIPSFFWPSKGRSATGFDAMRPEMLCPL